MKNQPNTDLVQAYWDNEIAILQEVIDRLEDALENLAEARQYYGQDVDKWQ